MPVLKVQEKLPIQAITGRMSHGENKNVTRRCCRGKHEFYIDFEI